MLQLLCFTFFTYLFNKQSIIIINKQNTMAQYLVFGLESQPNSAPNPPPNPPPIYSPEQQRTNADLHKVLSATDSLLDITELIEDLLKNRDPDGYKTFQEYKEQTKLLLATLYRLKEDLKHEYLVHDPSST